MWCMDASMSCWSTLSASPSPCVWKARARIGERVKWYKDVEELTR